MSIFATRPAARTRRRARRRIVLPAHVAHAAATFARYDLAVAGGRGPPRPRCRPRVWRPGRRTAGDRAAAPGRLQRDGGLATARDVVRAHRPLARLPPTRCGLTRRAPRFAAHDHPAGDLPGRTTPTGCSPARLPTFDLPHHVRAHLLLLVTFTTGPHLPTVPHGYGCPRPVDPPTRRPRVLPRYPAAHFAA